MTTLNEGVTMGMNESDQLLSRANGDKATARYLLGSHLEYAEITWLTPGEDNQLVIQEAFRSVDLFKAHPIGGCGEVVVVFVMRNGRFIYLSDEAYSDKEYLKGCSDTL